MSSEGTENKPETAADPRSSIEKYRLFADATDEGIVIHDYKRILAANSHFCRMFGYSEDNIEGTDPFAFIAPDQRAVITATVHETDDTSGDSIGVRADGGMFPIEVKSRTVTYQGRLVRLSRVRDLTKRRQAEATLNASEERFRATFEQAAVGIAHVAIDGSWLRVNRRLCEITGYTHDELLKLTFQDITHPDDLDADLGRLNAMLAGELERYSIEKRYFRKDQSIVWVNLTVAMVRDGDGRPPYFISIVEDISARKEIEETLRQSQKMDIVGQLTSSIAHDFGNFLNVIKGNLQLLKIYQSDKEPSQYVDSALAGAELAEKLIRQLLSFSRRQDPEFEATDINRLIRDIFDLLRKAVTGRIALTVDLDDRACIAFCDRGQLETALFNLVLNAGDAIGQSIGGQGIGGQGPGTIRISTSIEHVDGHVAQDAERPSGEYVRIEVADNGHGMPPDVAARACEPFFTTKGIGEGTGLGLSQVARCMTQMNGFIDINSRVGVGTKIGLFLRCHTASP